MTHGADRRRWFACGLLLALVLGTMAVLPHGRAAPYGGATANGPPYVLNASYVNNPAIVVDGNLNEPAWSDANTTLRLTTETFNGWNLTIRVFHNNSYLFVGVELVPDTSMNPNDYCELAFDVNNNNLAPPEVSDLKIQGKGTTVGLNDYSLYNGNGAGWTLFSDQTNTPNPWPAGYAAIGEMQTVATYEFQLSVSSAWGTPTPANGSVSGFIVHGRGQAGNHVWWPDHDDTGNVPAIEYCDNAANYGDLVFIAPPTLTPDHLQYISGADQAGLANATCAAPVVFTVQNETNVSVAFAQVNFTITSTPVGANNSYFIESGNPWYVATSDGAGNAQATLHLGTKPGDYVVNVSGAFPGLAGPTYNNTINATAYVGPADHLVYISGNGTSAEVGQAVPPFWARVVDAYGNNVSGSTIWWNITGWPSTAASQSLANATSVSGTNGLVSTTLTLGEKPGQYNVSCANLTLPGAPGDITFYASATTGSTQKLAIVSGNWQTAPVGSVLAPYWARVTDQLGNNVSGAQVWWNITGWPAGAAGHSLDNATSTSDASGLVSTNLTMGDRPGQYNVSCANVTMSGNPHTVTFTSNATVGTALGIQNVSGGGQSGPISGALLPFWARVTDQYGNSVSGSTVWWNITTLPGGAVGMVLSNASGISDADGLVSSTLTLGDLPGAYDVTAENLSFAGNKTAWFNSTASGVPLPSQLEYVSGSPQGGIVGASLLPVWAKVVDQFGSGIAGVAVYWNITIATLPPGASGQFLYNNSSVSDASGFVSTRLQLGNLPGWYNFTCENAMLPGAQKSVQFNSTAAVGAPATISIGANLTAVPVQQTAALTIWLNDSFLNGCPGYLISLSFDANPSTPNEGYSVVTDNGDGTYSATYTAGRTAWVTDVVRASQGGLSSTVGIDVVAGEPYGMSYVSGNGQTGNPPGALALPFEVQVKDQFGNPCTGVEINWTIDGAPAGATGQAMAPAASATNATGVAGSVMTLGSLGGWYFANATNYSLSLVGEPVSFSAQARTPVYVISIYSGNNQTATAGTRLAQPLIVSVMRKDWAVGAGAGVPVWFNVTGGGGSVEPAVPVITDGGGLARANLTLGALPGSNSVSAQISTTSPDRGVSFVATGTLPSISPKLAANVSAVAAGGTLSYVLTIDNDGTEPAKGMWVNDTLPGYMSYLSDTSSAIPAVSGSNISWFVGSLAPGPSSFVAMCSVSASAPNNTALANSFTVECTDLAGRPMASVSSNIVYITVRNDLTQRLPPAIDGVPDLVVHHDWDYMIDVSPYVSDPDDALANLTLILSDNVNVHVDAGNNMLIILNYSIAYLNTTQVLNITVSDGFGSDWDIIEIRVTDNFPPEIKQLMPDVLFDEDGIVFPFNITDYFLDREGDSLYFVSGFRNTNITIFDNGTVRVSALQDWFGMERVKFRASQTNSGALVETLINVTVRPVNDAPYLREIANQSGKVGVPWPLNLSDYAGDVDNIFSELKFSTDSAHASVTGQFLTLRYDSAVQLDIITLTVSDGSLETHIQININVQGEKAELIPWWMYPIIIGAIVALIAFIIYKRRKPLIEQAFLIYKDGALIAHATSKVIPDMDSEIFTSMLTAIQDFVKDSFKDEKKWDLRKLEFGDHKIMIEHSSTKSVSIALVYRGKGDEKRLLNTAKDILSKIEIAFGDLLADWDGNLDNLRGTRDIITEELGKG